jgi:putative Holliday junction resolvase
VTRVLAVDLGERRIGLALSDPSGTLASPLRTLEASGDPERDRLAIVSAARDAEAQVIVVGLPRSLSGREGPAARRARAEASALAEAAGEIRVELHDERFTTRDAERALGAAGRRGRERRARVDAAAAAIILQSYLDAQPGQERE